MHHADAQKNRHELRNSEVSTYRKLGELSTSPALFFPDPSLPNIWVITEN